MSAEGRHHYSSVMRLLKRPEPEIQKMQPWRAEGREIRKQVLQLKSSDSITPELLSRLAAYARDCGDQQVFEALSKRLQSPDSFQSAENSPAGEAPAAKGSSGWPVNPFSRLENPSSRRSASVNGCQHWALVCSLISFYVGWHLYSRNSTLVELSASCIRSESRGRWSDLETAARRWLELEPTSDEARVFSSGKRSPAKAV